MASSAWPPVYDFDELKETISELRRRIGVGPEAWFYEVPKSGQPSLCQGDLILLDSALVFLDDEGYPAAGDDQDLWVVLGNSCDLDRNTTEVPWTQLLPVFRLSEEDESMLPDLRAYRGQRVFYFPPKAPADGYGYFTEFTRPVTADRRALSETQAEKRLSYKAWILFHACLVRYLARHDGRNDF